MYFERTIEKTLRNVDKSFPVLMLTGPRQAGKTTLLLKLAGADRKVVSLDNPTFRALAKKANLQRFYAASVRIG